MITAADTYFRTELLDRRHLLAHATRESSRPELRNLLADVDAALARLDRGTFGDGPFNSRSIDHIAAALLRVAQKTPGFPQNSLQTPHCWKWGDRDLSG